MKENLEKILGEEKLRSLEEFLDNNGLNLEELYKKKPKERMELIMNYCKETGQDFSEIYSAIETAKENTLKKHALRAAVAAIFARDGPAAVSDLELYKRIEEKIKEYE